MSGQQTKQQAALEERAARRKLLTSAHLRAIGEHDAAAVVDGTKVAVKPDAIAEAVDAERERAHKIL